MPSTDQSSLNLVMKIKESGPNEPAHLHFQSLQAILKPPEDGQRSPLGVALDRIRTVHFARFFFIEKDYLCLVTSYDGRFEDYVNDFIEQIFMIFDALLEHLEGAPQKPVQEGSQKFHVQLGRQEFINYVRDRNIASAGGGMYSAYPNLSVVRILTLAGPESGSGH